MKNMIGAILAVALVTIATGACSRSKPIVVGSKNDTEQTVLGEIVAQHLERRLQAPVQRRLSLGNTDILYQALSTGEVAIYPEYTGVIESVILKEPSDPDAAVVLERARAEMGRRAQTDLFGPLGFENPSAIVVHAADAAGISTLSQAAEGKTKWKIGVSFDFQQRNDGLRALSEYRLPTGAPVRALDPKNLFPSLTKRELTMIATTATDGRLTLPDWKVLADDRHVFPPQQAVLLARQDVLNADPRLRAALMELTGKITQDAMRKMNARVDVEKQTVAQVATDFLASAGLK